jgi:dUTP pyrophosphatase
LTLEPGERTSVDVGLAVGIPAGCAGFTMGRSSMNKAGVYCITGVIDAGYTGAISVILHNQSGGMKIIQAGDRIAQLVIMPVILAAPTEVDVLDESERGSNGFGSSGR